MKEIKPVKGSPGLMEQIEAVGIMFGEATVFGTGGELERCDKRKAPWEDK